MVERDTTPTPDADLDEVAGEGSAERAAEAPGALAGGPGGPGGGVASPLEAGLAPEEAARADGLLDGLLPERSTRAARWARAAGRFGLLVAISVAVFLMVLRWNEPRLLYPRPEIEHWEYRPGDYGLEPTDHWPVTSDGVKLHAWYLPPAVDAADGPVVLYSHGNAELVGSLAGRMVFFRDMGAGVFAYDYRGYGKSERERPHEEGTILDAVAAYDYLVGELGVAPDRIVGYGHSLGAAVTLGLAERRELAGVVLESPFTSVPEVAREILPVGWLGPLLRLAVANTYRNDERVRRLWRPLVVIHGRADDIVPAWMGRRVAELANEPKRFVELEAGHNDVPWNDDVAYIGVVAPFLAEVTGRTLAAPPPRRPGAAP